MMKIEQKLNIPFNYNIYFTHNLFDKENLLLAGILSPESRAVLFIDSGVVSQDGMLLTRINKWFAEHHRSHVILDTTIIEGGEICKNELATLQRILNVIHHHQLDRHSYVMIMGGGSLLDTVGFAASISHRGIRQIRIPTTALSQDDSGVGVKNSFNFFETKNYFGTFTPPFVVINDLEFLKTLTKRDWLAGIAEAFKVAIIKDRDFLNFIIKAVEKGAKPTRQTVEQIIIRSAQLHASHIANSNDPFETGSSRPLDFGHWSAHYLETLSKHELRHGEAVAIGIMLDMTIARERGLVTREEYQTVCRGMKGWEMNTWHPILEARKADGQLYIFDGIEEFRQHIGGELNLIMPDHLGGSCNITTISHDEVEYAVNCLKKADETEE